MINTESGRLAGGAIDGGSVTELCGVALEYYDNAGTPDIRIVVKTIDTWNTHTEFALGTVVNEGGTLHIQNNPERAVNTGMHIIHRLYETEPLQSRK